jgi:hypothetical protein
LPRLSAIERMKKEIEKIKIEIPEMKEVQKIVERTQEKVLRCQEYLEKSHKLNETEDIQFLNEIIGFYE